MRRSRCSIEEHRHAARDLSHFPEHVQKYPSLARIHLCDVKRNIYYPNPPTLRNIDRHEVLHKLSDEHCRHTTFCGPDCFDVSLEKSTDSKAFVRRDFCIDKLLEKYALDPRALRNINLEILKVCPSERKHFEQMCNQHKAESFCIKYDPSIVPRVHKKHQNEERDMQCCLLAPWN